MLILQRHARQKVVIPPGVNRSPDVKKMLNGPVPPGYINLIKVSWGLLGPQRTLMADIL